MFNKSENIKQKRQKTKDYDFIDGLHFLYVFSTFHSDEKFELDEPTQDILFDAIKLAKIEYDNPKLADLNPLDIDSALDLALNIDEEYHGKIETMSKDELKALTKNSYVFAKKILRKIETPIDIPSNPIADEIQDISWQIYFAESKKEQDALFKKQDSLFAKADELNKKNEMMVDGQIKSCITLSTCLSNAQYTYAAPVKSVVETIKAHFSGKKQTTIEKEKEL